MWTAQKHFKVNNIKPKALEKVKEGLIEECRTKTYINNADIIPETIGSFRKSGFVIDDKQPSEYVKSIIKIILVLYQIVTH